MIRGSWKRLFLSVLLLGIISTLLFSGFLVYVNKNYTWEDSSTQSILISKDFDDWKPIKPPKFINISTDATDETLTEIIYKYNVFSKEVSVFKTARARGLKSFEIHPNQISFTSIIPESVFPPDDRVKISPTTGFPWSSICKLYITAADSSQWIGTGFIVGLSGGHGFHVLTAGHCVYLQDHGGWASSIEVVPAMDGLEAPFWHAWMTNVRAYSGWVDFQMPEHDWALLTLDRNVGDYTGWMGIATSDYNDSIYTGLLHTAGYPGDLDSGQYMYWDSDYGDDADEYNHWYHMDTYGGQSGSPVWYVEGDDPYILSIHAYGGDPAWGNMGTRIDGTKFNDTVAWCAADSPPVDYADLMDSGDANSSFSPLHVIPRYTNFSFSSLTINLGTNNSSNFNITLYASTDQSIDPSDFILAEFRTSSVEPFTGAVAEWNGTLPLDIEDGLYWVLWYLDSGDEVNESSEVYSEINNVGLKTDYQLEVDSAHATFTYVDSSYVSTMDDVLQNGTYPIIPWFRLGIYNDEEDSNTILGDLYYHIEAQNITGIDWEEVAEWNSSYATWTSPIGALQEDQELFMGGTISQHDVSLNFTLNRYLNETTFTDVEYQRANFSVCFTNSVFLWSWGSIEARNNPDINASFTEFFQTDAPLESIESSLHKHLFTFNMSELEAGIVYNFSTVIRVEYTGVWNSTFVYKPDFVINCHIYEDSQEENSSYSASMSSEKLPEYVNDAQVSTNTSNSWLVYWISEVQGNLHEYTETSSGFIFSSDSGPVGTVVELNGSGFVPNAWIEEGEVTFRNESYVRRCTIIGGPIEVDENGEFTLEIIVPQVAATGSYELRVVDGYGNVAYNNFIVTGLSEISLSPTYGPPGSSVNIQGWNFTRIINTEVQVDLTGNGYNINLDTCYTNSSGYFEGTFNAPAIPFDFYTVNASTPEHYIYDDRTFYVNLIIVLSVPDSGSPGTNVTLVGTGFTAHGKWNATFGGIPIFVDEDVDVSGNIQGWFLVPDVEPGDYTINVIDVETEINVSTIFEVLSSPLSLLVRGGDDRVYYNVWNDTDTLWTGWIQLPGSTPDRPTGAIFGTDLHLVVRGSIGGIYHGIIDLETEEFSGWSKFPGGTPTAPSLAASDTGLVLTVRGNDNGIYYSTYDGIWSTWTKLPGSTPDAPGTTVIGGTYHVMVRGSDSKMYHGTMTLSTETWNGWTLMTGTTPSQPVLCDDEESVYLVVRGSDDGIYYREYDGSWLGWSKIPGSTALSPGAAVCGDELNVCVAGMVSGMYHGWVDLDGLTWSGWGYILGNTPSPPSLIGD